MIDVALITLGVALLLSRRKKSKGISGDQILPLRKGMSLESIDFNDTLDPIQISLFSGCIAALASLPSQYSNKNSMYNAIRRSYSIFTKYGSGIVKTGKKVAVRRVTVNGIFAGSTISDSYLSQGFSVRAKRKRLERVHLLYGVDVLLSKFSSQPTDYVAYDLTTALGSLREPVKDALMQLASIPLVLEVNEHIGWYDWSRDESTIPFKQFKSIIETMYLQLAKHEKQSH